MEILGSTQYVDLEKQKEKWYQLSVINQWDWSTKSVCFSYIGNTLISYCLNLCTPISNDSYKTEKIENLTDEMKDILLSKGYSVKIATNVWQLPEGRDFNHKINLER